MKLAIVDRDGTLNAIPDGTYVLHPKEWQAVAGAPEALAALSQVGWTLVVVVTQPGLGRGLLDAAELHAVHARMLRTLSGAGARIDAVFFCPHDLTEGCKCLHPRKGLLAQAGARYGLEPQEVVVIGSDERYVHAAQAWGAKVHRVPAVFIASPDSTTHPLQDVAPAEEGAAAVQWHSHLGECIKRLLAAAPNPRNSEAGAS